MSHDRSVTLLRDVKVNDVLYPKGAVGLVEGDYTIQAGDPGPVGPGGRLLFWYVRMGDNALIQFQDQDVRFNAGAQARLEALLKDQVITGVGPAGTVSANNRPALPIETRLRLANGLNVTFRAEQVTGLLVTILDAN